jgi:hypothetical protein
MSKGDEEMKPEKGWKEIIIVPKKAVMIEVRIIYKRNFFRKKEEYRKNWLTNGNVMEVELSCPMRSK